MSTQEPGLTAALRSRKSCEEAKPSTLKPALRKRRSRLLRTASSSSTINTVSGVACTAICVVVVAAAIIFRLPGNERNTEPSAEHSTCSSQSIWPRLQNRDTTPIWSGTDDGQGAEYIPFSPLSNAILWTKVQYPKR